MIDEKMKQKKVMINQRGGIFLGMGFMFIMLLLAGLWVMIISPVTTEVNDSAGLVLNKSDGVYSPGSSGNAILFAPPLILIVVGLYGLWRAKDVNPFAF